MVARISAGKSISRMLNYNEHKIKQGKAELLDAIHFGREVGELTFRNKLHRFELLMEKNANVKTNAVHISLNFHPSENHGNEKLQQIAAAYLQKIGFSDQPYLVYQHFDAGHPHIHVVTTNVKPDGKRIDLHNIGRNQSENARKQIEEEFKLVHAEGRNKKQAFDLKITAQKVRYGKSETKTAIANVLNEVVNKFRYTSLAELNAVLKQYNVMADRGGEGSRIYQKNGLFYRVLDDDGNKIGTPIKASAFYIKPTLAILRQRFEENKMLRQEHKQKLKVAIDWTLHNRNYSLPQLINTLERQGVLAVPRQHESGLVYGITYIDWRTKCVFNGSDLGKDYSAQGIQNRCEPCEHQQMVLGPGTQNKMQVTHSINDDKSQEGLRSKEEQQSNIPGHAQLLFDLLKPIKTDEAVPYQLAKKKRKRRAQHL